MSLAIETENLARSYRTYKKPEGLAASIKGFWNREYIEKQALRPTTLRIESGQIVGFVGANGAGKTTLLKILSGLIYPSSGTAKVLGFSPWERDFAYLRQISILLGQKAQLWWDIPAKDSFSLLSRIYDLDFNKAMARAHSLAEHLNCAHALETQLRRLSLGERMKMEIIGALLHEPQVVFLDEPTIGLDLVSQESIRKFLSEYVKSRGTTVILTSHYMDDIAKLADRLLLISQGTMVFDGSVKQFMAQAHLKQRVVFKFFDDLSQELVILNKYSLSQGQRSFDFEVDEDDLGHFLGEISSKGKIQDIKIAETDFEDVIRGFLQKESRLY